LVLAHDQGVSPTRRGAEIFWAILGDLSTPRKHALNLMNSIKSAFADQPADFTLE
jgi:hypothetical protein